MLSAQGKDLVRCNLCSQELLLVLAKKRARFSCVPSSNFYEVYVNKIYVNISLTNKHTIETNFVCVDLEKLII